MTKTEHNQAFIDGQNLYLGTTSSPKPWKIDLIRFRKYLAEKYHVDKAYYFLGCVDDNQIDLYNFIQEAGFILVFREHNSNVMSKKKGNVDTDIVFTIMQKIYLREKMDKIYLVSGDGDYFRMVSFLKNEGKLGKVLFPARHKASSLYRQIEQRYWSYLDNQEVKNKIAYKKRKKRR